MPNGVFEQFPYTNFHDLNLDWILQTLNAKIAEFEEFKKIIDDMEKTYEKSADLTANRKLDTKGNFTGTWFGDSYYKIKTDIANSLLLTQSMIDAINARESIGLIFDGKTFPYPPDQQAITRTIDGGAF